MKLLIQLCSSFDGVWVGSAPCLGSDAPQKGQGGLRVKDIETDNHQLVLKPHRNLPSQQQRSFPWVLFILSYDESDLLIHPVYVRCRRKSRRSSAFVTWPDRITQHKCVSGERLWLGFPKGFQALFTSCRCCRLMTKGDKALQAWSGGSGGGLQLVISQTHTRPLLSCKWQFDLQKLKGKWPMHDWFHGPWENANNKRNEKK